MKGNIEMETINPRGTLSPIGESEIFKEFDNLVGSKFANLVDFFEASRFLFIVNDQDRSTPTARIIKHMDNHLKAKGGDLRSKDVHVILATGSHGPPKEEELIQILGDYYDILKPRIIIHSAKECDSELIGTSERGTPINVNRLILGYDRILTINSIEPHYFAGYTGGRKSIVPGICHYDTIEANHKMAMDENSRILALKGNPVHEDMMEITNIIVNHLRTLGTDVNAIACVESGGEIYGLSAGDINKSWERLLPKVNELYTAKVEGRFDIILAETSFPQNQKLYQALKSFENCKPALREGGIIILEAKCDEGIGPDNFYRLLTSAPTPKEIVENIRMHYTLGAHKTTNLLAFLDKSRMYVVSELPDEVVKNCFCVPFKTIDKALDAAIKELDMDTPKILKISEANNVVPLVSQAL